MRLNAMRPWLFFIPCLPFVIFSADGAADEAESFATFVNPLVSKHCLKCHGGEETHGEVSFQQVTTEQQLLAQPNLINKMIEVVDARDMPPEGEAALDEATRTRLLETLKSMLRRSIAGKPRSPQTVRRLNRFQYNNSVRDLFQLKLDVFELPEKLMTRHDAYLLRDTGRMRNIVHVSSDSLNPRPGLRDVKAFPKDLRAEHGFDNQADQLTLSPLLLDAFLRLSVSIVESPDFNEQNVGQWKEWFVEPAQDVDRDADLRRRLSSLLTLAFRGPVDDETLGRYVTFAKSRLDQGLSFPDTMKKVVSAVLSSPMFLYRSGSVDAAASQYELASDLSFFLWGSGPDRELLTLAEHGELGRPDVLNRTLDRMLSDPRIERFLDSFPSQWMQLENVLAATPDPRISRYFSVDPDYPAGLQMLLEPLLLFDSAFIENRPVVDLIASRDGYRSEFLKAWYESSLTPPKVDVEQIAEENRRNADRRKSLEAEISQRRTELNELEAPVKARILASRKNDAERKPTVDLQPYAAWEFNGDLTESVRALDLAAHGKIEFKEGMVVLKDAYLQSPSLQHSLKEKTLEVVCSLQNLDQAGGGVMGIQGPGDFFDTIVLGERKPRHWISGSNLFIRTDDFADSFPETRLNEILHLVMVYAADGTTTLYRDGVQYGQPFRKGAAVFPEKHSFVLFGLRHLPPGGNRFLSVNLDKARLYDRALTVEEIEASASCHSMFVSEKDLLLGMTPEQKERRRQLLALLDQSVAELKQVPAQQDPAMIQSGLNRRFEEDLRRKLRSRTFERVVSDDPRFGGIITNAAMLSMNSGPKRTHPIARGAWIIEVIFNDPPPPPPNDVPPLNEDDLGKEVTIRERFAAHRSNPSCAGCHSRIDPLGFAMENFDITGRWRDRYENGAEIDSSGTLLRKHTFKDVVEFKQTLVKEEERFARAFAGHLLRFAVARKLEPADSITIETIISRTRTNKFRLKDLIREVVVSAIVTSDGK